MQTPEALHDWILQVLRRQGWSQRQFSVRASLAPNMVSIILGGHRPSEQTLRALASAAKWDEDHILYLGGYRDKDPMQGRNPEIEDIAERLEEMPEKKLRAILPIIWTAIEKIGDL